MIGTARIIVIFVELIVIGAFVIRVIIDVQAKELDKTIETTEATLGILQASENKFRTIQQKAQAFEDIYTGSPTYVEVITEVNKYLPKNAIEINVQIDTNKIAISGLASDSTLGESEAGYKSSSYFDKVELKKFETGTNTATSGNFIFNMEIKTMEYRVLPETIPTPIVTITPTI